jgi:iron complex outermembrane recepter protein
MNIPIASASKKSERLFDAPVSSYTITRAEIEKSGATTIMEALRLAPGVLVREQSNGNYDIHIRGFDNLLRTSQPFTKTNSATLVMIDDRPVFNHNLGGTQWETLPVDLIDVERIEVIRGPAAPLFGPNAVTGVINIITHRMNGKKSRIIANSFLGIGGARQASVGLGRTFSKQLTGQISLNTQTRQRFDEAYYSLASQSFEPAETIFGSEDAAARYPNPAQSMSKVGANAFLTYSPSAKAKVDISLGGQSSEAQKILLGATGSGASGTYFTTNETKTGYVHVKSEIYGAKVRASYLQGTDGLIVGANPSQYDYQISDVVAEYALSVGKASITPGVSYQSATYSDTNYLEDQQGVGFLGQSRTITTMAPFVRTDIKATDRLRMMAALRADKFSSPDDWYLAYQFATTYNFNAKNLVRAVVSRSNSGSFLGNNFLNIQGTTPQIGNTNLNLFTIRMAEVGYRSQLSRKFQVDLDLFVQQAENLSTLMTDFNGTNIFVQFQNVPVKATQKGITLGLNYASADKIQFKPFITVQQTNAKDVPLAYITPAAAAILGSPHSTADTQSGQHTHTPSIVGGFFANYKANARWNINVNGYYFDGHTQYDFHQGVNGALGVIEGKFLVNSRLSYKAASGLELFANIRNVFNDKGREFYGADRTGALYLFGLNIDLQK